MLTRLCYILYLSIIIILPSFTIAQVAAEELYRDDYDCEALYLDADTPDNPRIRNAIDFDNIDTKVIGPAGTATALTTRLNSCETGSPMNMISWRPSCSR